MSAISELAVACLDAGGAKTVFGTRGSRLEFQHIPRKNLDGIQTPGAVRLFEPLPLGAEDLAALDAYAPRSAAAGGPAKGRWQGFCCIFDDDTEDRIALYLSGGDNDKNARGFLSTIWPVLREDCLLAASAPAPGADAAAGDDALLWMISKKIDVAVMVVNAQGHILRANSAAKGMLEESRILRRRCGGIFAAREAEGRAFREAVAACARADSEQAENIVFLEGVATGRRVPVTLSRFSPKGGNEGLVLVMLPLPPDRKRIEMLAKKMGLTQSEARVAALMQLGISNRDAALLAGLKEQTFSTYAKRVLNKLDVSCRAEMAQMLTWQAHGGRVS